ncbi:LysR family transcriptional regulator [Nocardioides sp. AE5]|uniref:LysR family transcriptional regulator n=1 Tax=Nocardioides sp. AE5 TaxID=2962573 RepID=UPI002881C627|nr:LysR family transcriptional regulator [Nocardioides sp. AE5]MDT0201680.1 LysR family transcriptional regulator [Nocardioides sp. AE5]
MQIRDLAWLLALAEHGHVTDTAAILGVSQPTLSRAVARIEDELGVRLFERLPSGVRPTSHAELVLAAAGDIVERDARMRSALASRLDPEAGVVHLAFLDSMATSLVPRLLRGFHEHAPRVRVVLTQEAGHSMLRDLESGAVELAITSVRPAGEHGWLPLQHERLVAIVPPTHRFRDRKRIDLAELAGDGLITPPDGFGYRDHVRALLAEEGVAPRVSFESVDLATIEGLVAAGLGFAIVPEQFAGVSGSVGLALRSASARRTIGVVWRNDVPLAPPAARMLDFLRENWAVSPA